VTPDEPALRPGVQLASAVCGARVVVVRVPSEARPDIACGGSPMVPANSVPRRQPGDDEPATLLGKRYVDATETVELLCTAAGAGVLTCDGVPMTVKAPKALPASD
jgi:hypothetical protein